MAFTINDRQIDVEIEKILRIIREEFGIKNASKTDVIRYLLSMKKQGKKTDFKWKKLTEDL